MSRPLVEPDASGDPLNERERQVLLALVDAHIETGEPIGSKALADAPALAVSPQTIRNTLAALHERGLIAQPHTSAGRIPTDAGLRYYVDSLVQFEQPAAAITDEIEQHLEEAGGVDQALREASRLLSRLVRQTSIVLVPAATSSPVQHLELLRLRDDAVLFILVTADGRVQNRLLEWRDGVAPARDPLARAGAKLTGLLVGQPLHQGRALLDTAIADAQAMLSIEEEKLLTLSRRGLLALSPEASVHVDGTSHLVAQAEDEASRQRTRELLVLLEETREVRALFSRVEEAPGLRIFIGQENPAAPLAGASMVSTSVGGKGARAIGMLGVIGPRHLNYARVVPIVDATARVVSRLL